MGKSHLLFPHLKLSKNTNVLLFMIFKTDNTVTNVYKRCRQKKIKAKIRLICFY